MFFFYGEAKPTANPHTNYSSKVGYILFKPHFTTKAKLYSET